MAPGQSHHGEPEWRIHVCISAQPAQNSRPRKGRDPGAPGSLQGHCPRVVARTGSPSTVAGVGTAQDGLRLWASGSLESCTPLSPATFQVPTQGTRESPCNGTRSPRCPTRAGGGRTTRAWAEPGDSFTLKIRLRGTSLFVEARLTFSSALGDCGRLGAEFASPPPASVPAGHILTTSTGPTRQQDVRSILDSEPRFPHFASVKGAFSAPGCPADPQA